MDNFIVSARKYRPSSFSAVVGQAHVTNTLKSAILLGQLAHAFLFAGPRGVGKTTCARILAKAINCEKLTPEGEPCNSCDSCNSYNEGKSINIHELDAASNNSVDDIRNLIDQTRYIPPSGKKSVYIIDEVHMLSQAAFNAFLKTLEEPPPHVLFILATTEKHKILPTILSRCQKFDFRRIRVDDIAGHLEHIAKSEGVDYEFAALQQIALKSDGALRDALSLFDQLASYGSGKLSFSNVLENLSILDYDYYFQAVDQIQAGDHKRLLLLLNEVVEKGFEAKEFLIGMNEHFRNLLVCQAPETVELLETSENVKARYLKQSREIEGTLLLNAFHLCSETEQKLRNAALPRLQIELALIKLAHLNSAIAIASGEAGSSALPEKKKLIAEEPPARQDEKETVLPEVQAPASEKTPEKKSVPLSVEKKAEKELPVTLEKKPSKKRAGKGFVIPSDLNQVDMESLSSPEKEEILPETVGYQLDPSIHPDPVLFKQALDAYAIRLRKADKINLATVLENLQYTLNHNRIEIRLGNQVQFNLLEREVDLISFLRIELQIPSLFSDFQVDEQKPSDADSRPYTEEEKLLEMAKRNESVGILLDIFKTRIIYS
jgi:DNA polymerase-3 subunit gamma/tau